MESISVQELKALLDSGADLLLIDVRNQAEVEVAAIPGAELFPLATIESGEAFGAIRERAGDRPIYVHCKLGGRSAKAVTALSQQGIVAINVDGGIDAWSQQIDPAVPRY